MFSRVFTTQAKSKINQEIPLVNGSKIFELEEITKNDIYTFRIEDYSEVISVLKDYMEENNQDESERINPEPIADIFMNIGKQNILTKNKMEELGLQATQEKEENDFNDINQYIKKFFERREQTKFRTKNCLDYFNKMILNLDSTYNLVDNAKDYLQEESSKCIKISNLSTGLYWESENNAFKS